MILVDSSADGTVMSVIEVKLDAVRGYEEAAARMIGSFVETSCAERSLDVEYCWNSSGWLASLSSDQHFDIEMWTYKAS